jgi:hypothetical protein
VTIHRMTSPAEPSIRNVLLSAGVSDSDSDVRLGLAHPGEGGVRVAALEPGLYQDMRWCWSCGGVRMFEDVFEVEDGRLAVCLGCEGRFFRPMRSVTEAA